MSGVPRVLEDVAKHYFGDLDNTVAFKEVRLPGVGSIDYVLVRHKPLKPEVDEFVSVEVQSDSTTSTGALVQWLQEFLAGHDVDERPCKFGINTYDTIKRAITQLINKGIVYEAWNTKCYWAVQVYIYDNLMQRYGFKRGGFDHEHASRFALYDLATEGRRLRLAPVGHISTSVDQVYQAMKNNPGAPTKDDFVEKLNAKLRARLGLRFYD